MTQSCATTTELNQARETKCQSSSFEVADIVRQCAGALQQARRLSIAQQRILRDIAACRTAVLGGHVQQCDGCNHRQVAYNSCRNRHCPKCQAANRAAWLSARERELLPVPYFHVVFTLPEQLSGLALQNKRVVYGLLFRAAAQTLLTIAADPQRLGAKIGFLAVLHTWGQNLLHHPHVHVVIPSGGISTDGSRWIAGRRSRGGKEFFLPVRILSSVFRGKFIAGLKRAYARGELQFHGQLVAWKSANAFQHLLNRAARKTWVVYAKPPFGGPAQVLKYLARYTHRVAISNRRLIGFEQGRVSFGYKDYADGNRQKTMTLEGTEFLRRFLLHELPKGFPRIRHYGLLANRDRTTTLNRCRQLLGVTVEDEGQPSLEPGKVVVQDAPKQLESIGFTLPCPHCKTGRLIRVELILPTASAAVRGPNFLRCSGLTPPRADTS